MCTGAEYFLLITASINGADSVSRFHAMLSILVKATALTPMSAKFFNWSEFFMSVILYWLIQKYRKYPFFFIALWA